MAKELIGQALIYQVVGREGLKLTQTSGLGYLGKGYGHVLNTSPHAPSGGYPTLLTIPALAQHRWEKPVLVYAFGMTRLG